MSHKAVVQRVRIYLSEHDEWGGRPLYLVVLEQLRLNGATGATALRGLAGFGPGHGMHTTGFIDMREHPPVVLEWVERVERVATLLPQFDELLSNALITIEDVQLYRATLRSHGPFAADERVRNYMRPVAQTLSPAAPLSQALAILMHSDQTTIPILDPEQRVLGLLTGQDIVRRTRLRLPPRLLRLLDAEEFAALLSPIATQPIAEVMSHEPRSTYEHAPIPQALITLIEWNYDQLPVLNAEGRLLGLFGRAEVLTAALAQQPATTGEIRDAESPTPVSLVMQATVPQIPIFEPMALALQQLVSVADQEVLVVDAAGRLQGHLTAEHALNQLRGEERTRLISAFQHGTRVDPKTLPGQDRDFHTLIERNILTLNPTDTILEAARTLLEQRLERVPVVDADGKLLGMLSQGGILRALAQASG